MSVSQPLEDLAEEIIRRLDELKDHLELYQEKVRKEIVEQGS